MSTFRNDIMSRFRAVGQRGLIIDQVASGFGMDLIDAAEVVGELSEMGRIICTLDRRNDDDGNPAWVYVDAKLPGRMKQADETLHKRSVSIYLTEAELAMLDTMCDGNRSAWVRDMVRGLSKLPHTLSVYSLGVALVEALPHIRRQLQGRHEQDRADAEEWLEKWEAIVS